MSTKSRYQPPYTITPKILNRVAQISEFVGRLSVLADAGTALQLRRVNRIRTIHGSLAIEGNTLSEEQYDFRRGIVGNPPSRTPSDPPSRTIVGSAEWRDEPGTTPTCRWPEGSQIVS